MRLIDADALKELFEEDGHLSGYIEEFIDDCPTIEAEPVRHGEWVDGNCSTCGHPTPSDDWQDAADEEDVHFCYFCGTKMNGGKKNG